VSYWLRERAIEPTDRLVAAILAAAKGASHIMADDEVMKVVERVRADG
jgi:hypothetical protein